jgi:hypothetical protein
MRSLERWRAIRNSDVAGIASARLGHFKSVIVIVVDTTLYAPKMIL